MLRGLDDIGQRLEEIGQTDNADHAAFSDHRRSFDVMGGQHRRDFHEIGVFGHGHHGGRHEITGGAGVLLDKGDEL